MPAMGANVPAGIIPMGIHQLSPQSSGSRLRSARASLMVRMPAWTSPLIRSWCSPSASCNGSICEVSNTANRGSLERAGSRSSVTSASRNFHSFAMVSE